MRTGIRWLEKKRIVYNWKNVKALPTAIKAVAADVVLSGHGGLPADKLAASTIVPPGIEFWVLCPPGGSIADETGQALENGKTLSMLGILNPGSDTLSNCTATVYKEGASAPDYVLSPPRGISIQPGVPHLLGVEADTPLSQLWLRVSAFVKKGQTIRCFWAACTAIDGATNPVVLYQ